MHDCMQCLASDPSVEHYFSQCIVGYFDNIRYNRSHYTFEQHYKTVYTIHDFVVWCKDSKYLYSLPLTVWACQLRPHSVLIKMAVGVGPFLPQRLFVVARQLQNAVAGAAEWQRTCKDTWWGRSPTCRGVCPPPELDFLKIWVFSVFLFDFFFLSFSEDLNQDVSC